MTLGSIGHLAINADDVSASRAFYEKAFDWTFSPHFGQEDFLKADTASGEQPGPFVVLQARRALAGVRVTGTEATVSVTDLAATIAAAVAAGGTVLMEPVMIPTVGTLAWLADPSGNPIGAMQYEATS